MLFFVRSAMCALYPRTAAVPGVTEGLPGIEDTGIDEFLVSFRRDTTFTMWLGVLAGAFVFHMTPLLTVFVPLPAFLLPQGLRDKHAYRIATSSLYLVRQALMLVKLPAGLCWGRHPAVRAKFAMTPYASDPDTWRTS